MSFQCIIVTPEAQVLDEPVSQAVLPAHDGQIGILTGRAPLLVKLGAGELTITAPGGARRFFVDGGVAQMKDNKLTVLTDTALPPEQIDAEEARAELAEATAEQPTEPAARASRDRRIARAKGKLAMAG